MIFQNFDFGDQSGFLEIVENNTEENMTMTRLNGNNLPSNLISVSKTLRIVIQIPCTSNTSGIDFYAVVKAENYSGKLYFFCIKPIRFDPIIHNYFKKINPTLNNAQCLGLNYHPCEDAK